MPGLGNRPGIGDGNGIGDRASQLPARDNLQDRRQGLEDRLSSRDQIRDDRLENRDDIRQDWQDRYDDFYDRHEDWHHGFWHGDAGEWWDHMWDDHTALMAFGTTMWGLNRAAYGFGYWGYENPYYTEPYSLGGDSYVDYSEPIPLEEPIATTEVASTAVASPVEAPSPGVTDFDVAREAFYSGNYSAALVSTNKALAALPNDPIIHEFRSLVLFAQGKYAEAAAGLYSVLSVGPGWDWTTMSSLYPSVDVYTKQLRALEKVVTDRPNSTDATFVLAYHYLTMGKKGPSASLLRRLERAMPEDRLVKELLALVSDSKERSDGAADPPTVTASHVNSVATPDIVGAWSARGQKNATFDVDLKKDGSFTWTYKQGKDSQTVKGAYALDGDVLAMEPESGGVMLAQVSKPKADRFHFQMLGAPDGDPGLEFASRRQ